MEEALVLGKVRQITASVFINDDESGLQADNKRWLERLALFDASSQGYAHNRTGNGNADSHMKRQAMNREVVIAVTKDKDGLRPVGRGLLRRVRRTTPEAGAGQGHRGIVLGLPGRRG